MILYGSRGGRYRIVQRRRVGRDRAGGVVAQTQDSRMFEHEVAGEFKLNRVGARATSTFFGVRQDKRVG